MAILRQITKHIRTYSSTGPNALVPVAAEKAGLEVAQGVWLDFENHNEGRQANLREVTAAVELARNPAVTSIIVGNEVQLFRRMTVARQIQYIQQIRKGLAAIGRPIPITCADAWDQLLAHRELVNNLDYVMMHVHPYWHGMIPPRGVDRTVEIWNQLRKAYPGKTVVIGETGYPSAGNAKGDAKPTLQMSEQMLLLFTNRAVALGIPYYYFEFSDELWKGKGKEDNPEPHWGLFYDERRPKFASPLLPVPEAMLYVDGEFAHPYQLGAASAKGTGGWVTRSAEAIRIAYPGGQDWGAAFVTVGNAVSQRRRSADLSEYTTLKVEGRSLTKDATLLIGMKSPSQPDDGSETKVKVTLRNEWSTVELPLAAFVGVSLQEVYVPVEFVFEDEQPTTVEVRAISLVR